MPVAGLDRGKITPTHSYLVLRRAGCREQGRKKSSLKDSQHCGRSQEAQIGRDVAGSAGSSGRKSDLLPVLPQCTAERRGINTDGVEMRHTQGHEIMKRKTVQCVSNLRGCMCCTGHCRALWVMEAEYPWKVALLLEGD